MVDAEFLEPSGAEALGLSIAQALSILRAHWKLSAALITVLMSASFYLIKLMPKTYLATATLMVNYENKDPLAGREIPSDMTNTYIPTQIELMLSPVILYPVIAKLQLTRTAEFAAGFKGPREELKDYVLTNLRSKISVQQGRGSQLLYVTGASIYAVQAANIANAIADEYLYQERARTNQPAGERATRYSEQMAELRDKVTAAQEKVAAFRKEHGITEVNPNRPDEEANILNDLETKLEDARNQRRIVEARQSDNGGLNAEELKSSQVQTLKGQLSTLEATLAEQRATLGPNHPKIRELESKIAAVNESLAEEIRTLSTNTDSQLSQARALENKYRQAVDQERAKVMAEHKMLDDASKLLLELDSAQAAYKRALDGYDQVMFASTGNYDDVNLISRATPPAKASKPEKPKFMLAAAAISLAIGLGAPFGFELLFNRRVRCKDDFERGFGIPVLAQLERLRPEPKPS
jgi:uncharacterized protein involved in exopolysaccharide biosynthesis